jgi:hypothetical protein
MTGYLDFVTEVQKAVEATQMFAREVEAAQKLTLRFARDFQAAQDLTLSFAREFETAQKLAEKFVPTYAAQKLAQELAPAFDAVQRLAREREALLESFAAVPTVEPCSRLDWSVISPPPPFRMPSFDPEPSNERTIVRPEVKRKIGFRP